MPEILTTKNRLRPLDNRIELNRQLRGFIKKLEEQFPIQVGAAKAVFLYDLFGSEDKDSNQKPRYTIFNLSPGIDDSEYLHILATSGFAQNQPEEEAFKLATEALLTLDRLAANDCLVEVSQELKNQLNLKIESLNKSC